MNNTTFPTAFLSKEVHKMHRVNQSALGKSLVLRSLPTTCRQNETDSRRGKSTGGHGETTICALVMICLPLLYFPPQIGRPRGSVGSSGVRLVLKGGSSHRICPKLRALVRGRLATGGYCASEDRDTEGYSSRLRLDCVFKASQQIRQVHSATRSHALLWCITKKGTMRNPASGEGSGVEWWDGWAWRVVQALAQSFSSRAGTVIPCS